MHVHVHLPIAVAMHMGEAYACMIMNEKMNECILMKE